MALFHKQGPKGLTYKYGILETRQKTRLRQESGQGAMGLIAWGRLFRGGMVADYLCTYFIIISGRVSCISG